MARANIDILGISELKWTGFQFSSVSQVCQTLCDPWTAACKTSLSITTSRSLLKLMSIVLVIPSIHLILCLPLFLPSAFPSIRVFSKESTLCIKWPTYWNFSFNISPEYSLEGLMLKLKFQYFGHLMWNAPVGGRDWGQEEKGKTEDEMVGWHHQLNGHEFE